MLLKSERTILSRCADVRALLPELVEGELSEAARARAEGHLAGCRACREEESRFRAALGALSTARAPYPGDLYPGFSHKLALANGGGARFGRQLRLAGATCLLLVVVGVVGAQVYIRLNAPKPVSVASTPTQPAPARQIVHEKQPDKSQTGLGVPRSVPTQQREAQIVLPKEPVSEPIHKPKPRTKVATGDSFLDVVDETGTSLRDRLKARRNRGSGTVAEVTPKDMPPAPSDGLIPSQDAVVRVGGSKLRVQSSYREDAKGNRTEVHVNISAPEPVQPDKARPDKFEPDKPQ